MKLPSTPVSPQNNVRKLRRRRNPPGVFSLVLIGLLLVMMGWSGYSLYRAVVLKYFVHLASFQQTETQEEVNFTGLLVKSETLVYAPIKGQISLTAHNGDRVGTGDQIAVIKAGAVGNQQDTAVYAPASGILCTGLDGLEDVLTPGSLDVLGSAKLDKLDQMDNTTPARQPETAEKGQPVAKIVDNLAPINLYGTFNQANMQKLGLKVKQTLNLDWSGSPLTAQVAEIKPEGGGVAGVWLTVNDYPDQLVQVRKSEFRIIHKTLKGMLVPEQSMVTRNGQPGLYIIWKQTVHWVPVQVVDRLNGMVSVKGPDIDVGVKFVLNPGLVREGDEKSE